MEKVVCHQTRLSKCTWLPVKVMARILFRKLTYSTHLFQPVTLLLIRLWFRQLNNFEQNSIRRRNDWGRQYSQYWCWRWDNYNYAETSSSWWTENDFNGQNSYLKKLACVTEHNTLFIIIKSEVICKVFKMFIKCVFLCLQTVKGISLYNPKRR